MARAVFIESTCFKKSSRCLLVCFLNMECWQLHVGDEEDGEHACVILRGDGLVVRSARVCESCLKT